MAYVITQNCCNDAACVAACPVGCIHPTPDEPGFATAEMLYIDPKTCIDCGACADACPVDAIFPEKSLKPEHAAYTELNSEYYAGRTFSPTFPTKAVERLVTSDNALTVAIVGSGPAGMYTAKELLRHPGIRVEMFERLNLPHGLIRYGVAPDHPATKSVVRQFRWSPEKERRFRLNVNTEVGKDVSHDELVDRFNAVIYAHGAFGSRRLDIPGAELENSIGAGEFVGWYNDHPDYRAAPISLSGKRAVIIGNGNVALDMARILLTYPLGDSTISEVEIVARRGPENAAFTTPELLALTHIPGLDVIVDPADLTGSPGDRKMQLLRTIAETVPTPGSRRIILRFNATPTEILGGGHVEGVRTSAGILDANLVIHAVGFHGRAIPGVPFDNERHVIPNIAGRVVDPLTGEPLPAVYTVGWIKRGPSGVIGTNRTCAQETVGSLLADQRAGALATLVRR
ncbi:FAD-dependent oxidoreductase [Smaragdicoccus niigatensis]|uniref:FAD-dependent oxidoreductase n=1 Tax=Smaragdicoccus niigatensis TaxID=359359 RepID=UPI0003644B63|nr:FAD-dependent oxidoreductase [Smaragdicoccus niigatensis]